MERKPMKMNTKGEFNEGQKRKVNVFTKPGKKSFWVGQEKPWESIGYKKRVMGGDKETTKDIVETEDRGYIQRQPLKEIWTHNKRPKHKERGRSEGRGISREQTLNSPVDSQVQDWGGSRLKREERKHLNNTRGEEYILNRN